MNMEKAIESIETALEREVRPTAELNLCADVLRHTDVEGRTMLMLASRRGNPAVVEFLLQRSKELLRDDWIDARDHRDMTALLHAAKAGHEPVVDTLVRWGASVEISDSAGMTYRMLLGQRWRRDQPTEEASAAGVDDITKVIDLSDAYRSNHETVLRSLPAPAESVSDATSECIRQLVEGAFVPERIIWDQVDITGIIRYLTELRSPLTMSLSHRSTRFLQRLLQRAVAKDESWASALIGRLALDLLLPIVEPVDWDPRVMWNGTVLVRASHRVFALQYERSVFLSNDQMEQLFEDLDELGDRVWTISTVRNSIRSTSDVDLIDRSGNNIVGISDAELPNAMRILRRDLIAPLVKDMRGGVAIRVFETGFTLYSLYTASNALDFAVEYLFIYRSDFHSMPASMIIAPRACHERDDRSQPGRYSWGVTVYQAEADSEQYVGQFVEARFNKLWREAQADTRVHALDMSRPQGFGGLSLTDLARANLRSVMVPAVHDQFDRQPRIFSPESGMIRGNDAASRWSDPQGGTGALLSLRFTLKPVESAEEPEALREWMSVEGGLTTFGRRVGEIIREEMDRDWGVLTEVEIAGELPLVRIELWPPNAVALDLRDVGRRILAALDEPDNCLPGSLLSLEVPSMRVYQSFHGGEVGQRSTR